MRKTISVLIGVLISITVWADTAECTIEIEDVRSMTTYTVNQKFTFTTGGAAHRKHFELPGTTYQCTLAFFDLTIGTMISCENRNDLGHTFFQSDRSGISENTARNTLTFRIGDIFVSLKSFCNLAK